MYMPTVGRWISKDPLPEHGEPEILYTHEYVAQRLRSMIAPYAYAANNPVNKIDPSGLIPVIAEKPIDYLLEQLNDNDFHVRERATGQLIEYLMKNGISRFCTQQVQAGLSPEAQWRFESACVQEWKIPLERRITQSFFVEICCEPNDNASDIGRRLLPELKRTIDINSLPFNKTEKILGRVVHSGNLLADEFRALEMAIQGLPGVGPINTLIGIHDEGLETIKRACTFLPNKMIRIEMKFRQYNRALANVPLYALSYAGLQETDKCCPAIAQKP